MSRASELTPGEQQALLARLDHLDTRFDCEYGHIECTDRTGGPCANEVVAMVESREQALAGPPPQHKPRLTDKVIRGVIVATSSAMAGDIEDAFGNDSPENRKDWDAMRAADSWARQMRSYRKDKKGDANG